MTTLTLTHQKFSSPRALRLSVSLAFAWALERERALALFFLLGIIFAFASYIGALYVTFGLGSVLSAQETRAAILADDVREKEYQLQAKISRIPEEHKEFLSSMERVSTIRYLGGGEGYASTRYAPTP